MIQAPRVQLLHLLAAALILACAPLSQLTEINSSGRAFATTEALVDQAEFSALTAYQNLDRLPGYRLQADYTTAAVTGEIITTTITSEHDAGGNSHTVAQTAGSPPTETYTVNGQTYRFDPLHKGWVAGSPANTALDGPHRWLLQFGAIPVEAGRETVAARSTTRYRLTYLLGKLAEARQPLNLPKITGTIWVDDETGALLKSDIQIIDENQPRQKFTVTVTEIGNVSPIQPPSPVVDPAGMVSATATAQAWTALGVGLDYQGRHIEFELVPLEVRQQSDGTTAEMRLLLRNLPPEILQSPEPEPFLTQLGTRLTLSIPQNNLTAGSTSFQLEDSDPATQSVTVSYRFQADLEDFNHVELILSNAGNPVFAPVPVAGK